MSCEEQNLARSIADALGYPRSAAMMCWDAAARTSSDGSDAADQGRARRARAHVHPSGEETNPAWTWLNGVTLRTCRPDHAVPPQRLQRMLELLAEGVHSSDPRVAAAARRTRRVIAALGVGDIAVIAALDESTASAARALASALGIADADGTPLPWREMTDWALRDSELSLDERAALGDALWRMRRRDEAIATWQSAASGGSTDAALALLASDERQTTTDILASLPPEVAERALAVLVAVWRTVTFGTLPDEWRWTHPRWSTLVRAVRRIALDTAEWQHALLLAVDQDTIPRWTPPPRESLPPPLLRIVTRAGVANPTAMDGVAMAGRAHGDCCPSRAGTGQCRDCRTHGDGLRYRSRQPRMAGVHRAAVGAEIGGIVEVQMVRVLDTTRDQDRFPFLIVVASPCPEQRVRALDVMRGHALLPSR